MNQGSVPKVRGASFCFCQGIQLGLYLIGFGGFYFLMKGANEKLQAFAQDPSGMVAAFRLGLYPFYAMGHAITAGDFLDLLIFTMFCVIPFGIVCYVLTRSFIRIVTARSCAKKQQYKAGTLKGSPVIWAMTKKDLARFFNNPSYMFNTGIGLLYLVGMGVLALINGNSLTKGLVSQTTGVGDPGATMLVVNALILALVSGTIGISAVSLSAESQNLWILKSMPVKAKDVLTAKWLSHFVLAGPASILSSILYLISSLLSGSGSDFLGILVLFLLPLTTNLFSAITGVTFNLFYGKMDFSSITKAAKSASTLVPMLLTLVVLGLPVLIWLLTQTEGGMSIGVIGIITTGFVLALDVGLYFLLGSATAQKRLDVLGN